MRLVQFVAVAATAAAASKQSGRMLSKIIIFVGRRLGPLTMLLLLRCLWSLKIHVLLPSEFFLQQRQKKM